MLNAQFRPLDKWPGERNKSWKRATFRVTYARSLDLLESELSKLRAKDVVIQVDGLTLQDIRNDGWPRSSWTPGRYGKSGVIVSFQSAKGAMSFPCDRFTSWQDNLRAIALSLEALRTVDRYGVTRGNEQYRGWSQIEAPKNGHMSRGEAAIFLASILSVPKDYILEQPAKYIRQAQQAYHPDRVGTEPEKLARHEMFVRIGHAEVALTATEAAK